MNKNISRLAGALLNLLLAIIIASGGFFAKPPEPAQAELWWAQSWGTRSFASAGGGLYAVYFYCHVRNVGITGHTIWDSVVYMKESSPPWDDPAYDSGNIGDARGGLAPGNVMNANPCATNVSPGRTYYWAYRYRETLGGVWGDAGTQSFSTNPPTGSSYDATGVGTTTATLNGRLASSGSNDCDLRFITSWAGSIAGSPSSSSSPTNFSAGVSGLSPGTTYSYYSQVSNFWGTDNGATIYFTTLTPPSVTTNAASALTYQSATLNGFLNSAGTAPASLNFVTSWAGTVTGSPSSSSSAAPFTYAAGSLTQGTTYNYYARATNVGGTVNGSSVYFTTYTKPSVSAAAASDVTYQSATLNGNVTALGSAPSANVSFDYGTSSGSYTLHTTPVSQGTGVFIAPISSLSHSTTYYWRAVADGGATYGTSYSTPEQSFTTRTPPAVATDIATGIYVNNVVLNGALTSLGSATNVNVRFGYGTDHTYATKTTWQNRAALGVFQQAITGLSDDTYYYRAEADGGIHGPAYGAEKSFTIGGGSYSAQATTEPATAIGGSSATLNGIIWNLGSASSVNWSFQYGTVSGYYSSSTSSTSKNTMGHISFPLAGLLTSTTYYYRIKIDAGSAGGKLGEEKSFTTGNTCPTVNTDVTTIVGAHNGTINGNLLSLGTSSGVYVRFQYGTSPGIYFWQSPDEARSAAGTFNYELTGLSEGTTYYYRAKADDGTSGGSYGAEKSFLTGSTCPTATTELVNPIGATTATLHGNLADKGTAGTVNVTFQWGDSPGVYINETAQQPLLSAVPFTANLTGLTYGNTYYYRAKADGGIYGGMFGNEMTFKTDSTPPTILTDTPTAITPTGATVNGVLTTMGTAPATDASFKWGIASGSYPNETPPQSMGAPGTFSDGLTGLTTGATYYYRAKAVRDPYGGAFGDELVFLTGSVCPTATTQTATSITATTATLNGNLLTMGTATSINACFQYGTAPGVYANQTPVHSVTSPQPFTADLGSLTNGTRYYYRAKADGGIYGSVFGVEKSFTAGSTPLTILTDTPTNIATASATLNGILTSLGGVPNALVSFQWGSASGVYPNETTQRTKSTGGTFTDNITGLTSGSLYFYRAKVDDGVNGGAFGVERSFRAGATCPTGTTQTATAIGTTAATLNGNLLTLGSATPTVNIMFQWGTAPTHYVNETTPQPMSSGAPFAAGLTGLTNGTTYYYRAKIDGGINGSVFGAEKSFTAGRTNPSVTTDGVTTITSTGGTLNGILMSLGTATDANVSFQWGTATGVYPFETTPQLQTRPIAFTATLTGLTDNVIYYYRARVDDGTSGGAFGAERTFRAGAICPTATTQTATGITTTTAILQGNLLTIGSASVVDACFQWGTTPLGYVNQTLLQAMDSGAPFIAPLGSLVDGTTYYYRAHVDGGSNGMCVGVEKSFIAGRNPPVVLTDTPTSITPSAVTLNGIMTTLGTAPGALVSFQWGTTTGVYPDETPQQDYSLAGTFTDNLTGLAGDTIYYYRAKADDGVSGGAFGVERSFKAGETCPTASTEPATEVAVNSALLHANLTSLGSATSCNITFEWGTDSTVYPNETSLITRTALGIVSCNLTGLAADTQYFFRAKADGGLSGSALGLENNFFTGRTSPTATTDPAYITGTTTATLRGNLTNLGSAPSCNVTFEWGRTPGIYLFETPSQFKTAKGAYQDEIGGLSPNTTYYFRAKADGGTHGGAFSTERTLLTAGATSTASGGEKGPVTFSSSAGNLTGLTAAAASSLPCSFSMVKFPFGVFSFTITNLTPGGTAVVSLGLPDSIADNAMYYKCQDGRPIDCTSLLGHNNGDNTLTLSLTDGGLGDADGVRDGVIVDPGGPAVNDFLIGQRQGAASMISTSSPSQIPVNPNGITPQSTLDRVNPVNVALANIVVSSAELERHEATVGEPLKVTAMVTNKGFTGGAARIMVTVNGYEAEAQGVNVAKGGTVPVEFYVSGDSPGQYRVYVNNVSAGEFNVSAFKQSDLILWLSTICVLAALVLGALFIMRRRRDEF